MKYLSITSVLDAYKGCKGKTQNKFWGLLAILRALNKPITPAVSYTFQTSDVSQILDSLFSFNDDTRDNRRGDVWSVLFSAKWFQVIPEIMFDNTPNIVDVAVWFFRKEAFPDDIDANKLVSKFIDTFYFSKDDVHYLFNTSLKNVSFVDSLYSDKELLSGICGDEPIPDTSKLSISFEATAFLKSNAGNLGQAAFVQTLYSAQSPQKCLIITQFDFNKEYSMGNQNTNNMNDSKYLQQIFYGAPGTGKSKTIKDTTEEAEKNGRVFRTTFHPDSDYSTFVGCYKPSMKSKDRIYSAEELAVKLKEIKNTGVTYPCHKFAAQYWRSLKDLNANNIKEILSAAGFTEAYGVEVAKGVAIGQEYLNREEDGKIIYTFTPQAFTNAYVKAWNTTEDVYLIIEEINRGNCAQIFGDLFQLLDRGDNGKSEYPIDADTDLGNYIAKELESGNRTDFPDGVKDGKKLVLPQNLYIWATMNTSDQSLFPIDSAFKRRWDWKYLPIEDAGKKWKIKVNGNEYDWYQFLEAINKEVLTLTHSEDKQLGYFFAKANNDGFIDAEKLVNKVYFYLWTDVFKDYDYENQKAFRKPNSNDPIAFKNFFENLKNGEKVNEEMAERVLINLELEKRNKHQDLFG